MTLTDNLLLRIELKFLCLFSDDKIFRGFEANSKVYSNKNFSFDMIIVHSPPDVQGLTAFSIGQIVSEISLEGVSTLRIF